MLAPVVLTCSRRCAHMLALIHIRCALILMHALINCALYSCTHALIGLSVSCVCSALVLIVPSCSRCACMLALIQMHAVLSDMYSHACADCALMLMHALIMLLATCARVLY